VPFRVLTDMDLGYALSLGLGLPKDHGDVPGLRHRPCPVPEEWRLVPAIPATLVVGRDGRLKARFVDPDFRHRMRTEDIVEAVREAAQG
jgi:hypothetical protein